MPLRRWHAELAWLGGADARLAERVLIEADGERLVAVRPAVDPPADAVRLEGLTIPGLANAHSHVFHRALRGRTHAGRGDFWSWRAQMYQVAARLDPGRMRALARAAYAEMALAGITAVGEFHYLHHAPGGARYADANAMGAACIHGARDAGLRITLLDTCYLQADVGGAPLEGVQLRFGDGDAEAWAARAGELADGEGVRIGAAIHSVRAVDPASMQLVAEWAGRRAAPLHLHLSEQRAENERCLAVTGHSPAALAAAAGALGPRSTAVHATHLLGGDIGLLGGSGTSVCLCPTTERDLADGVGPARALADAGSPLALGSDSHAVVDLFEEARGVELDERLRTERRGIHAPAALLAAATTGGMAALGWDAGGLAAGGTADFTTVSLRSPRLAGTRVVDAVAAVVFAATAADVTDVVSAGRTVVRNGRHQLVEDPGAALAAAIGALEE